MNIQRNGKKLLTEQSKKFMVIPIGKIFTKKSMGKNYSYEEEKQNKATPRATSQKQNRTDRSNARGISTGDLPSCGQEVSTEAKTQDLNLCSYVYNSYCFRQC